MRYKQSKYNFFIEAEDGTHLAFNAIMGGLAKVRIEECPETQKILQEPNKYKADTEEKKKLKESLIRGKFIIPEEMNEIDILKIRHRRARFSPHNLSFTIEPTLASNLRSIYHPVESYPVEKMSEGIQEGIVKLVESEVIERNRKNLHVKWSGGEPLLEFSIIEKLSEKFQKICDEVHCQYLATLTTNGYILNNKVIERIIGLGIIGVQITIDVLSDFYNKYRSSENGAETFNTVFNNLVNLCASDKRNELHHVTLGINYDKSSVEYVGELLDLFPKSIRSRLIVFFSDASSLSHKWIDSSAVDWWCCEGMRPKTTIALLKEAIRKGYQVWYPTKCKLPYYCPVYSLNHFDIDPQGKIYKCIAGAQKLPPVGYITEDAKFTIDPYQVAKWMSIDPFEDEECLKCKALPFCMGGCILTKVLTGRRGCLPEAECLEDLIEIIFLDLLREKK